MAKATHNFTLEYSNNLVELTYIDDNGDSASMGGAGDPPSFYIARMDDPLSVVRFEATLLGGNLYQFAINLGSGALDSDGLEGYVTLPKSTDEEYDFVNPVYNHVFSVKNSQDTYIAGKMNLVRTP